MKARDITRIAFMISIIIILGLFPPIPIALLPVPIILQNAGFMLSGLILGKKNGTIASVLFLVLVAVGFPILSGGSGGMGVFFNVTAGYLYAYPIATFLIGLMTEKFNFNNQNSLRSFVIVFIFGVLLIDFCGAIGVSIISKISISSSLLASLIFIPGDTIKAILTVVIAQRVKGMIK